MGETRKLGSLRALGHHDSVPFADVVPAVVSNGLKLTAVSNKLVPLANPEPLQQAFDLMLETEVFDGVGADPWPVAVRPMDPEVDGRWPFVGRRF
jgi:hypothetical protein